MSCIGRLWWIGGSGCVKSLEDNSSATRDSFTQALGAILAVLWSRLQCLAFFSCRSHLQVISYAGGVEGDVIAAGGAASVQSQLCFEERRNPLPRAREDSSGIDYVGP